MDEAVQSDFSYYDKRGNLIEYPPNARDLAVRRRAFTTFGRPHPPCEHESCPHKKEDAGE